MKIILNGLLFGLTLAIMLGPIFFTIIQTSINKGFGKAILVAIGVSIGDIIFIILAYYGLSSFVDIDANGEILAYAGAFILGAFGIVSILGTNKAADRMKGEDFEVKGFFRFIFKGLAINAISPFVPLFWIGTMSLATVEYNYAGWQLVLVFTTIIIVVFTTDLFKAFLAQRLSRVVTPQVMKYLNITVGVFLIAFSIRMIIYAMQA